MGAFSILPSSKPVHLDLKVTSDLVHMRGHGDDTPKLGDHVAFSVHCAVAETLAQSENGSKWRPLGRGSALYKSGPSVAMGGHASRSIRRDSRRPNGLAPSTDLLPNGSFWPNGYSVVTTSFVQESASPGFQARFRSMWTRYAPL
jgi:hypothetical protein